MPKLLEKCSQNGGLIADVWCTYLGEAFHNLGIYSIYKNEKITSIDSRCLAYMFESDNDIK